MLKKENRLHLDKDFDYIFKNGQSFYNNVFGLKVATTELEVFRLGILISTKVSKKAVVRNRIKRQFREIIQQELPRLKKGHDLIIIVLPRIVTEKSLEIKSLLIFSLQKLRLYN